MIRLAQAGEVPLEPRANAEFKAELLRRKAEVVATRRDEQEKYGIPFGSRIGSTVLDFALLLGVMLDRTAISL